ncbi:MAG: DNA mismatch repair endonuclease MutL [Bacillota bacterium]
MTIRRLDEFTISQIAAGEVVERPASVVKELVENSLDAGARRVVVEIEEGGKRTIRVTDDGMGMSREDALLALERHTTSKLQTLADLEDMSTLGFRGEALPSIAAVAVLELLTRPRELLTGTRVTSRPGHPPQASAAACAPGTQVRVSDLFSSLPARAKFLKSAGAEASQVAEVVTRLAVAHPDVAFRLQHGAKTLVETSGQGSLKHTLAELWGRDRATSLLPVEGGADGVTVRGLVGSARLATPSRHYQLFFVGRRWTKSAVLRFALDDAYQGVLPAGQFAPAVVMVELAPGLADVNVHPAKWEVRFRDERQVRAVVTAAVREALGHRSGLPAHSQIPPAGIREESAAALALAWPEPAGLAGQAGRWEVLGQVFASYILAWDGTNLLVIDQHAAAERTCYQRLAGTVVPSQALLQAEPVELTPAQLACWEGYREELEHLGWQVEQFGPRSLLVRALPAPLGDSAPSAILPDVLERLRGGQPGVPRAEEVRRALAACHGAVRAGRRLSLWEMQALVADLVASPRPYTCPHGRLVVWEVSRAELDRKFGR